MSSLGLNEQKKCIVSCIVKRIEFIMLLIFLVVEHANNVFNVGLERVIIKDCLNWQFSKKKTNMVCIFLELMFKFKFVRHLLI